MQHFPPLRLEALERSHAHVAHVAGRHLAPAHGKLGAHDVGAQVGTGDAQNHFGNAQVGRALGLFHRQPDRPFQPFEIDDRARAHALGRLRASPGHARLAIRGVGTTRDHARDLRRADIQRRHHGAAAVSAITHVTALGERRHDCHVSPESGTAAAPGIGRRAMYFG